MTRELATSRDHARGTVAWGARSSGLLSTREAFAVAWEAVRAEVGRLPAVLRNRFASSPGGRREQPPTLPDTRFVREAAACVEAAAPRWVVAHAFRTSLWGRLLGDALGQPFDEELLHVAALLHDLSLVTPGPEDPGGCFAIAGALRARAFAEGRGWPAARCDALAEAIALHMNVEVRLAQGIEAHLLHEGAACDVLGLRLRELSPRAIEAVLAAHPREGFKTLFREAMRQQATRAPRSRVGILSRLGFLRRITRSPWND